MSIFKAYDIRGIFGQELDANLAYKIGLALGQVIEDNIIIVGNDVRISSPILSSSLIFGLKNSGKQVLYIGTVTTDTLYFATGHKDMSGVMVTASHNPSQYNGFKVSLKGARSFGDKLVLVKDIVESNKLSDSISINGDIEFYNIWPEYLNYLSNHNINTKKKGFTIVIDSSNGSTSILIQKILNHTDILKDINVVHINSEPDGFFPAHDPNPLISSNVKQLCDTVLEHKADIGFIFDGDGDRCCVVDNLGNIVEPSHIVALMSDVLLQKNNAETIVYNALASRVVNEVISKHSGNAHVSKVGHSFIKSAMREHNALFGGEHSAHYYFREFWYADSGILPLFYILSIVLENNKNLCDLIKPYRKYVSSGEINLQLSINNDILLYINRVKDYFKNMNGIKFSTIDGLTINHDDWWLNIRASNTEPLLRLNVEGKTSNKVSELIDIVYNILNIER